MGRGRLQGGKKSVKRVTEGSGNVFRDLGLPDPDGLLAKAELVRQIHVIIRERKLTQAAAAKLLGLKQPDVSNLVRGRVRGFSAERLIQLLNRLDRDVEIIVRPKAKKAERGRLKVVAA